MAQVINDEYFNAWFKVYSKNLDEQEKQEVLGLLNTDISKMSDTERLELVDRINKIIKR